MRRFECPCGNCVELMTNGKLKRYFLNSMFKEAIPLDDNRSVKE